MDSDNGPVNSIQNFDVGKGKRKQLIVCFVCVLVFFPSCQELQFIFPSSTSGIDWDGKIHRHKKHPVLSILCIT